MYVVPNVFVLDFKLSEVISVCDFVSEGEDEGKSLSKIKAPPSSSKKKAKVITSYKPLEVVDKAYQALPYPPMSALPKHSRIERPSGQEMIPQVHYFYNRCLSHYIQTDKILFLLLYNICASLVQNWFMSFDSAQIFDNVQILCDVNSHLFVLVRIVRDHQLLA
jgi:hypothetical protein